MSASAGTMTSSVIIRAAGLDDAAGIAQVRVDSWRATYRGMIPDAYLDAMRVEESTSLWERILTTPEGGKRLVFVAEAQGEVIGFAAGMMLDEPKLGFDAELTGIYLQPQLQRQGLGQRLVEAVTRESLEHGATGMLVWVLSENQGARKFYEKLGAELLVEQPFTWDGVDLLETGYGWHDLNGLVDVIGK